MLRELGQNSTARHAVTDRGNFREVTAAGKENPFGRLVAQDGGVESHLAPRIDRGNDRLRFNVEPVEDAADRRLLAGPDDPAQRRRRGRRGLLRFGRCRVGQARPQHASPQHQRSGDRHLQPSDGTAHQQSADAAPAHDLVGLAHRLPDSVQQHARLQRGDVVPDHLDIRAGLAVRLRQRVAIQRAADHRAGLLADPFHRPRIGDAVEE